MRHLLTAFAFAASLYAAGVDGIAIHSTVTGAGPKTVIFVHGWTCNETTWTEQVPALAAQYRVVTLDLPGHGKSSAPKDGKLSMDLFARAIEAVRAEAKADRVTLVGHSMGTPVVVQYARLYPEHTAALVFVDGLVSMNVGRGKPDRSQWLGEDGRKNREKMVQGMFTAATTPELRAKIQAMMLGAPESTAAGAMEAMFDPAIWKNDTISLPILGLYAEKSSLRNDGYMKDHLPHMEYHEIPGTGHFLMLEKPAEFNRLLVEFLGRVAFESAGASTAVR
ncbi:MAG TPA: alpha/beta hydrolase [Candidatus Solibacter sp.]|nr:alpha/beta hydrolase [Candidatus Solibacter sp.]